MIHFNERLPRISADLIEAAALLTEGMTADEMDAMEREIEAERAALDAEAADERRDEALWQAEEERRAVEQEAARWALYAACDGDDGPF